MKSKSKIYVVLTIGLAIITLFAIYNSEALRKFYFTAFHQSGEVSHFNVQGKLDGEFDTYTNGQITQKTNFKNGLIDGWKVIYYPSGKVKSKESFRQGKYEGPKLTYYPNGQIEQRSFRKNNEVEGIEYGFYKNGRLMYKRNWVKDKLFGSQYFYFENEKVKIYHAYDILGEKFYLTFFDEAGKVLRSEGEIFSSNIYSINIGRDSLMVLKNNNKYDGIQDLYITDANPPNTSTAVKVIINDKLYKNMTFLGNNTVKINNAFPKQGTYTIIVDEAFVNKSNMITDGVKGKFTIIRSR